MKNCSCNKPSNSCNTCNLSKPKCNSCSTKKTTTCNTCKPKTCVSIDPVFAPRTMWTTPHCSNMAAIEGDGRYEIRTLSDKRTGDKFFPKTHTKSVVNDCGDTLDSLLNDLNDRVENLDLNIIKLGSVDEKIDIKIKDDFFSNTATCALSARKGYQLHKDLENVKSRLNELEELRDFAKIINTVIVPTVEILPPDWKFDYNFQKYSHENLSSVILSSEIENNESIAIKVSWECIKVASKYKVILNYKYAGQVRDHVIFEGSPSNKNMSSVIGYIKPDSDATEVSAKVVVYYGKDLNFEGETSIKIKDEYDFTTDFNEDLIEIVDFLGYEFVDEVSEPQKLNFPCKYYLPLSKVFVTFNSELEYINYLYKPSTAQIVRVDTNKIYASKKLLENQNIRLFFFTYINNDLTMVEIQKNGKAVPLTLENETHYNTVTSCLA